MLSAQLEVAFGCPAKHIAGALFEFCARGDVVPDRGPGNEQRTFAAELNEIEGRNRAAGSAEEHQHPARAQAVEALLKGRLAHRVVDHVNALAAGEPLDLRLEVLLGVENHLGGAGLARELGFGLQWRRW